jgi:hypothetical protein
MTVGLIINPAAGKKSGHGLSLAKRLETSENVIVRIIDKFDDLYRFLDEMADRKIDTLFISSGDGTVQAIQTDIAERKKFSPVPRLSLLAHGTTNMTAADLGFSLKKVADQADFIARAGRGAAPCDVRVRPTVRVVNPADGKVRHGMFVGTGAMWQGVVFCQVDVHATGLKGNWATFATLATALFKGAFFRPDPTDMSRIDRPYEMKVSRDGIVEAQGGQLLWFASTLEKLILGTKPFWGGKTGPMRSSVLPYPVPNVFRWAIPLMTGREDRKMPPGCISFCADEIEIETECPFVIDGEFFDPPKGEPLVLETGPDFSYVCG